MLYLDIMLVYRVVIYYIWILNYSLFFCMYCICLYIYLSACISICQPASLTHISTRSCPFLSASLSLSQYPVPSISPHYKSSITVLAVCSCVVWKSFNFWCFKDYYKYVRNWLLFFYDNRPFLFLFFLNFLLIADLIHILRSVLGLSVLLPQPFMKEKDNYYLQ